MFSKLSKMLKSKKAAGSIGTAIKVVTAVVLGAAILIGMALLIKDTVLPSTNDKVASIAAYEGDGEGPGGGSPGGVEPVIVPTVDAALNPTVVQEGWALWVGEYDAEDFYIVYEGEPIPDNVPSGSRYCNDTGAGFPFYYYYDETLDAWIGYIIDDSRTSYDEPILESINGKSVDLTNFFSNCSSMTTAPEIPNNATSMIGTFSGCYSLTTVPTIPSMVTDMTEAFYYCDSLTSIPTIPVSVENLDYTFYGCTSLTAITYAGTMAQWDTIHKDGWNEDSAITVVHCSDGDINI